MERTICGGGGRSRGVYEMRSDFGEGRARWREGNLEIWGRRDILLARLLFSWQRALFFVSAVRWVTICAGS